MKMKNHLLSKAIALMLSIPLSLMAGITRTTTFAEGPKSIFVAGATGGQGFPAVKELLKKGFHVRGLTTGKNPKAEELKKLGAEMVVGNLFDQDSLNESMKGMDALLFIPVFPTSESPIPEYTIGYNVITAAEKAGIQYMVHTSVDRAGEHESFAGWNEGTWANSRMYWLAKSHVIDLIKVSKIPHWAVLKPAYMMENFIPPKAIGVYPLLNKGLLVSGLNKDTRLTMMSEDDQGKLIAEAFSNFGKFDKQEIPLAGDSLTMEEIAKTISEVTGKQVMDVYKTREELMKDEDMRAALESLFGGKGISTDNILSATADSYEWDNAIGYTANIAKANSYGVKISTFREWCERHKDDFVID